jgi:hypothetical protein
MVRDTEAKKTILKPSLQAFRFISEIIRDSQLASKVKNDCASIQSMVFNSKTQQILVVWSPESKPKIGLYNDQSGRNQYELTVQRVDKGAFSLMESVFDLELNSSPVAIYFPRATKVSSISLESDESCRITAVKSQ